MKLNKKQRYYLMDNCYVRAPAVNLIDEYGWKKWLADNFSWELEEERDQYGLNRLKLLANSEIKHMIGLRLTDDELREIKKIKSK